MPSTTQQAVKIRCGAVDPDGVLALADPPAGFQAKRAPSPPSHITRSLTMTSHAWPPALIGSVAASAHVLTGAGDDYDALIELIDKARLVNAERYYRTMFSAHVSSWNLRDHHMAGTLEALASHLRAPARDLPAKIVVWAHNSHVGDARATEAGRCGEWTLGQLARERYREQAFLIGLTTYEGTVTAASDWDAPAERKRVRPALPGAYESLFHHTGIPRFMLPLRDDTETSRALWKQALERAIGVIYRPETERQSHYFHAHLSQQFDAILHFDTTRALEPLELTSPWKLGEAPETFPVGV